jgi:hypothetical protein
MDTENLDSIIVEAIKNNKNEKKKPYTEPKQSSIKIYREQVKKLYQSVNGDIPITMEGLAKIIVNFDMVKNYLDKEENDFSNATKKNYVNAVLNIIMYITDIDNFYKVKPIKINKIREAITTYWEQLIEKVNKKYLENVKVEEKHIDNKQFQEVLKSFRKTVDKNLDNKYLLQDFVLLLLYEGKYIPPLRNNYATLIITEPKDDLLSSENYLITNNDKNEILINQDKVDKKMGSKTYKINKSSILNKYLNKLIKIRLEEDKDYLLENADGNRLSTNGLTKLLQKIFLTHFNKKISSSDLRHIYISNLSPDLTNKKLSKISEDMRHSLQTQQMIYKKV